MDLVTVAGMMGYESLETMAIYAQPSEEDVAESLETLTRSSGPNLARGATSA